MKTAHAGLLAAAAALDLRGRVLRAAEDGGRGMAAADCKQQRFVLLELTVVYLKYDATTSYRQRQT